MKGKRGTCRWKAITRVIVVALAIGMTAPAHAADITVPSGSRIGIVPPLGFTLATSFTGFENRIANASIAFTELPTQDFRKFIQGMTPEALASQGLKLNSTEKIDGVAFEAATFRAEKSVGTLVIDIWMMAVDAKSFVGLVVVNVERRSSPVVHE